MEKSEEEKYYNYHKYWEKENMPLKHDEVYDNIKKKVEKLTKYNYKDYLKLILYIVFVFLFLLLFNYYMVNISDIEYETSD